MSSQPGGTKTVQCKYYLHGACNKGSSCPFSHDLQQSKPSMICKFYQQGHCAYGAKCRYDHVKTDRASSIPEAPTAPAPKEQGSSRGVSRLRKWSSQPTEPQEVSQEEEQCQPCLQEPPVQTPAWQTGEELALESDPPPRSVGRALNEMLCPVHVAGRCQRPNCPYLHGLQCTFCGKNALHPTDQEAQEKHYAECGGGRRRRVGFQAQQTEVSRGIECGICMEEVTAESRPLSSRRFGLLEGCNHAFCLECIRGWRQGGSADTQVVRSCPICRAVSYFVVPSSIWIEDEDQKSEVIESYKQGMSQKPCKHFNFGEGTCPFGSSCFYSHRYRDGSEEEMAQLRQVTGDDCTKVVQEVSLWDFLEASNTTRA